VGLVIFGMTIVAGIQEISRAEFEGTRNGFLVAVSIGMGVLPTMLPSLFDRVPAVLRLVLGAAPCCAG